MKTLADLPNLGQVLVEKLRMCGIRTVRQLKEFGSKRAFLYLIGIDSSVCLNTLYVLEGAVRGQRWNELPSEDKRELQHYYHSVAMMMDDLVE